MDKKSWLQKLEAMEQEQQESAAQSEPEENGARDFLDGRGKLLIFGGIGVVALVLLAIIFSSGKESVSEKQLQDILARLDILESRLVGLENQESGRQQSLVRMQGDFSILTMRVDKLSREMKEQFTEVATKKTSSPAVAKPVQQPTAQQPKPAATQPATTPPPAQPKPQAATQQKPAASKPVLHEVSAGETLFRISRTYDVTVDEIRQLNKLGTDDIIHPGQVLTIKR